VFWELGQFEFRSISIFYFPIQMQKYLVFIIPFLFACTTELGGCGREHTDINGKCYHQNDLDVLQDFIDNRS